MSPTEKETFEMYSALREEAWQEFDKKASYEWRMSFGIWTALAAATALCIKESETLANTGFHKYVIPAIVTIFILHLIFATWIQFTHRLNRSRQRFWSSKMATLAIPKSEDRIPDPNNALRLTISFCGMLVVPLIQLVITAILSAALYIVTSK